MLEVRDLSVSYGAVRALRSVSFDAAPGAVTAVLGANGAGKTTLLRTISGLVRNQGPARCASTATRWSAAASSPSHAWVSRTCPKGAASSRSSPSRRTCGWPRFGACGGTSARRHRRGVRALPPPRGFPAPPCIHPLGRRAPDAGARPGSRFARPRLLLLDEPSLGLAPMVTAQLMALLRDQTERKDITVVLVEQNAAQRALRLASCRHLEPRPGGRLRRRRGSWPPTTPCVTTISGSSAMSLFFDYTLDGIANGMIYAALALALVLIYRATRIINFAQGAAGMLTTFIAFSLLSRGLGYWWAFILVLIVGFAIGAATERVLIRPLHGKSELNPVIVTIGLLVVFEGLAGAIYGNASRGFPGCLLPERTPDRDHDHRVLAFRRVHPRRRAGPHGRHAGALPLHRDSACACGRPPSPARSARLLGVRVGLMLTLGWGLAGVAGSLAGLLVAPTSSFSPYYMDLILVYGFTAAVIGGPREPGGRAGRRAHLGAVHLLRRRVPRIGPRATRRVGTLDGRPHGTARRASSPARRRGGSEVEQHLVRAGLLRPPRQPLVRHLLCALVAAAVLYELTLRLSTYNDYQVGEIASYVVALVGLSLLTGVNGQISLGHGGFMAVGAYTMALLMTTRPATSCWSSRRRQRRCRGGGHGHRPPRHPR